jgi:hypothetical protein
MAVLDPGYDHNEPVPYVYVDKLEARIACLQEAIQWVIDEGAANMEADERLREALNG